uniref:CG32763 n=1 Tax=Macrostomum lignano TaxID=282301 RepID=A0A1I8FF28_9PLAT
SDGVFNRASAVGRASQKSGQQQQRQRAVGGGRRRASNRPGSAAKEKSCATDAGENRSTGGEAIEVLYLQLDRKEITLEEARLELPKLRQQPPSSKLASTGNLEPPSAGGQRPSTRTTARPPEPRRTTARLRAAN